MTTIASTSRDSRAAIDAELAARICVRPPYFALRNLAWNGQEFSAVASTELPASEYERGPMRAAELGRHGAIAGLCALAMSQGDSARRYYLASEAHYSGFASRAKYGSALGFTASAETLSKRAGSARITATDLGAGTRIMDLSVSYLVLAEPTFERLNRDHFRPTAQNQRQALPEAQRISPGMRGLPAVTVALCAGHFDGFPALPLAIVLWELTDVASELLAKPHWVREAIVQARDLCWAGQAVNFESSPVSESSRGGGAESRYDCRARSGERTFADMQLALSALG